MCVLIVKKRTDMLKIRYDIHAERTDPQKRSPREFSEYECQGCAGVNDENKKAGRTR